MPTFDIPLPDALTKAMETPRCVDFSLPKANFPELRLPTGQSIKGIADMSKGVPSDCSLNASLALQIAPIMGSMECLLNLLKFIGILVDVFTSAVKVPPSLPAKLIAAVPKLAEAGEKLLPCIGMTIGLTIPPFIKDLILLIVKMLKCALQSLKSVVELLDGLELDIASAAQNGNDVLAAQLQCAKENGMVAADAAMQAIDPIATLLELAQPFLSLMPGAPTIQLPALASDGSIDSLKEVINTMETLVQTLEGIAEAIPV